MFGFWSVSFGLFTISVLSVVMFGVDNFAIIWLCLELVSLGLIPAFFVSSVAGVNFDGLFRYFIVSGVSSALVIVGFMFTDLWLFSFIGLLIKLGVLPFPGWVYYVACNSNWLVVWELSTVLKCVVLLIPLVFGSLNSSFLIFVVPLVFVVLALFFWVGTYDWFSCWTHIMLASTMSLLVVVLSCSLQLGFCLFFVYCFWASLVVWFLSYFDDMYRLSLGGWLMYMFLLVSHPLSLSLFYKLVSGYCISSCSFLVIVFWLFYSMSEQVYLISWVVNAKGVPSSFSSFGKFL
uniref:NADH dehydrogenase subunit 2 n=1 Tax=Lyperosomum longicauda TaxID=2714089 RepID=A0A6H0YBH1_9TREM|nr:NADH dehydrogenase subunit 2 [Lyperosomum longicauda]QIX04654.1 NADH dehydrogenase subunit 2 [Lyperosomum longicauda]